MLITEDGDYEIQRYDRTLQGDEMQVEYTLTKGDDFIKKINALLNKQTD